MRLCSREVFVGFLLVLTLVLVTAISGCQTNVPAEVTPETQAEATAVESTPATDTATLTVTEEVSVSAPVSEDTAATEVVTTTDATITETAGTETMTATDDVSATTEIIVMEGSAPSEAGEDANPALIEAGLAIYRAQYCGVCHTLDAAETRGTFGPTHNGIGTTAAQRLQDGTYHGPATTAADYIHESIVDPQVYMTPGYATTSHRMPSYAHLDAQSLDALVAFLFAQK